MKGGACSLEHLLESEEDNEIEILPNGEIRAVGGSDPTERGFKKPLTMREDLGGEYGARSRPGMNLARIRRDIAAAQQYFDYVEDRATAAGSLMALIALQTSRRVYTLGVTFPESYPNAMPEVEVRKPALGGAAYLHARANLLSASAHVESGPARLDVRHTTRGQVACEVRRVPTNGQVARGGTGARARCARFQAARGGCPSADSDPAGARARCTSSSSRCR